MSIKEHIIFNVAATVVLGLAFWGVLLIFDKIISVLPF